MTPSHGEGGRFSPSNDRGGALLLLAMLIVFVVIGVALVVDAGRIASASRQKSQSADLLALSFLKGYLDYLTTNPGSFSANNFRLQRRAYREGLRAARRTGRMNFLTSNKVTSSRLVDIRQVSALTDLVSNTSLENPGRLGHVRVGRWFFERPAGLTCMPGFTIDDRNPLNRCPCINVPPDKPFGCFVECFNRRGCRDPFYPSDNNRRTPANAARVSLNTSSVTATNPRQSPIKTLFGVLAGHASGVSIINSGIVTVVPRHGVLLFDLSRSTTAETHYQFQKNPTPPRRSAEYAYEIAQNRGCRNHNSLGYALDSSTNALPTAVTLRRNPYINPPVGGYTPDPAIVPPPNSPFWDWRTSYLSAPNSCPPGNDLHCKFDYRCVRVYRSNTGNNPGGSTRGNYIVDLWSSKIPQPHTAMLGAANTLLEVMYTHRIPGDLIGFIGYDRTVNHNGFTKTNRYIPPTSLEKSDSAITNQAAYYASTDFQKLLDFTNPNVSHRFFRAKHDIFPRMEEFSDPSLAMWHAQRMLKNSLGNQGAQSFVVLVTAGLPSCSRSGAARDNPQSNNPTCGRSYDMNQFSLDELHKARVQGTTPWHLEGDGVTLHTILVSSRVATHRIAVKNPSLPSRCLTESEMRQNNVLTTLPPGVNDYFSSQASFNAIGSGNIAAPYIDPAVWLSAAARHVGGLWVPVNINIARCPGNDLSCLDDDDGNGSPDYSLLPELDSACAAHTPPPTPTLPLTDPSQTQSVMVPQSLLAAPNRIIPSGVDSAGRVFCNMSCSERLGQVGAAEQEVAQVLQQIYSNPPVSLVEPPS